MTAANTVTYANHGKQVIFTVQDTLDNAFMDSTE